MSKSTEKSLLEYNIFSIFMFINLGKTSTRVVIIPALRHRSGSTLVQIMECCLTAPSQYQNQCCLIISKVQWHSSDGNLTRYISAIDHLVSISWCLLNATQHRTYWILLTAQCHYFTFEMKGTKFKYKFWKSRQDYSINCHKMIHFIFTECQYSQLMVIMATSTYQHSKCMHINAI